MKLNEFITTTVREYLIESKGSFIEWFGNSKAVDSSGKPLLLYHGGIKFDKFRFPSSGDKGVYFTDNKDLALDQFALQAELSERDKRNDDYSDVPDEMLDSGEWDEKYFKYAEVKSAYLKMDNPKIVNSISAKDIPKNYGKHNDGFIAKHTGDFGYTGGQYVVFDNDQIWTV